MSRKDVLWLAGAGGLVLAGLFSGVFGTSPAPAPPAPTPAPVAGRAEPTPEQEACRLKLAKLTEAGFFLGSELRPGRAVLTVDEAAWHLVDFAAKLDFVRTFDCLIAGPGEALARAEVRGNMTNKVIGDYRLGRLTVP